MSSLRGFCYAQARIQARYGARTPDSVWQHLAALRGLSAYLEETRATTLAPWVAGFSQASDIHDIEQGVWIHFMNRVDEVSGWVPKAWRPAVTWTNWLPDLPFLHYLLNGGDIPAWASRSPRLVSYLPRRGGDIKQSVCLAGGAALVKGWEERLPLDIAWLEHWRASWPRCGRRQRENLEVLVALLQNYRSGFDEFDMDQSRASRRLLQRQLSQLFRRYLLQPVTVFAYLGLLATDLERLRSALVGRALFYLDGVP